MSIKPRALWANAKLAVINLIDLPGAIFWVLVLLLVGVYFNLVILASSNTNSQTLRIKRNLALTRVVNLTAAHIVWVSVVIWIILTCLVVL